MVDLSKVSQAVQKFVSDVAKTEGDKKKIDTQNEYDKLANYLANNQDGMGTHEKEFIQGFMIEFTTKKQAEAEKAFEDQVTDSVKKAVDKIAKRMENKKLIDTDDEAQALLNMLKNTKGDLNQADIQYIKNVLIKAGYGALLEENEAKTEETPAEQPSSEAGDTQKTPKEGEPINPPTPEKPKQTPKEGEPVNPQTPDKPKEPKVPKTPVKPKPVKPNPKPNKPDPKPVKPNPAPVNPEPKPEQPKPTKKKPTVTERGRTDGQAKATRLVTELNRKVSNNDNIRNTLHGINRENAYSFFKAFQSQTNSGVNQKVFGVSDLFNKIGYKDTARAMKALLTQAKEFGLENTPEYKALENNINFIDQRVAGDSNVDPEGREAQNSDRAIANLVRRMGQAMT